MYLLLYFVMNSQYCMKICFYYSNKYICVLSNIETCEGLNPLPLEYKLVSVVDDRKVLGLESPPTEIQTCLCCG